MKKKFLPALIILISCAAIYAQPVALPDITTAFKQDKIILPLTYRSGANPMIEVKVNGKGPYKFMVETGGGGLGARLDIRVFNELKPAVIDSVMAGDGSGVGGRVFPIVKLDRLDLGGYEISNASAMVRNYNEKQGVDQMDGAISLSYFKGALVELNFEKNQLIITKGKLKSADKNTIPFNFDRGIPVIPLSVGSKKIEANFDTGNMGGLTFHSDDVTKEMIAGEARVVGRATTVSGTFEVKEAQLNIPVTVGDLVFENPTVNINDRLRTANVGIRFAKQMNITFDVTSRLMKLEKASISSFPVSGNKELNEFAGKYEGDRTVTVGTDGSLYIQRGGGKTLKMVKKSADEFKLDEVPDGVISFVRTNGRIAALRASRDNGATWEESKKL